MSIYDLNPELDSPQHYGDPATDPVGTVRAYLGSHPSPFEPAQAAYYKSEQGKWWGGFFTTACDDNWVRDCPVIHRPTTRED